MAATGLSLAARHGHPCDGGSALSRYRAAVALPHFPSYWDNGFSSTFHSQRVKGARPGCTERGVIRIDATGGHDWRHGSQKTVVTGEPCGLGRDFHLC